MNDGQVSDYSIRSLLEEINVCWDSPSANSLGSMPLGNGDIGINVWFEAQGDLVLYLGKTDSWGENVSAWADDQGLNEGLMKLGKIRISLDPNPFKVGEPFSQTLKLYEAEVEIVIGPVANPTVLRIWVDANNPVVHLDVASARPCALLVRLESWRNESREGKGRDIVVNHKDDSIVWYYQNQNRSIPALMGLTFGAAIRGEGLVHTDDCELQSRSPASHWLVSIFGYTAQVSGLSDWFSGLSRLIEASYAVAPMSANLFHREWWSRFWGRSWVFASGSSDGLLVTRGYVLQRFVSAAGGRGRYPIKFNGSIFTSDYILRLNEGDVNVSADYRKWGGMYWFQNTRCVYWPMIEAGDFDMMLPLFKMYKNMLPKMEMLVTNFYDHRGAYFPETSPFWGELKKCDRDSPGGYSEHYYTPILELCAMMLDYFDYTGDQTFLKEMAIPIADAAMMFFDGHFRRDAKAKLLIEPANALETFWKATNPTPDVAGLRYVLKRLLDFPVNLLPSDMLIRWRRLATEVPEIPQRVNDDRHVLLPADQFSDPKNVENPELYAIFPFRLYGLGKPDLETARNTFATRRIKRAGCWHQDGIQAALLGDVDVARNALVKAFSLQDPLLRFPAFWAPSNDYAPDQDNGGNGQNTLQKMIVQTNGNLIVLLPAWPEEWNLLFKLHAPRNTTLEGRVSNGKLEQLKVYPPERAQDVRIVEKGGAIIPLEKFRVH